MRKRLFAILSALAMILASGCDPSPNEETGTNQGNETTNETPSEDGKTYIEFQNHEDFPAKIYQDSSHFTFIAEAPAKGAAKVEAAPNQTGVAFYPVFYLDIEGIPIVQSGPAVIVRVDAKKVNAANIPPLEAITTGLAYVKIENASLYSLVFNQGGYELTPLGGASTIVMSGESAGYGFEPQAAQSFSFMRNASIPIPFPNGMQKFERDTIYSFRYDGSVLSLTSVKPFLPAPQNIVLEAGDGSVSVKWDAAARASSYNVYYSTGETPPETPAQANIAGTAATISGLANGAAYYVWVEAVNAAGSAMSAPSSITLPFYAATSQEFINAIASINASSEAKTHVITLTGGISAGAVAFAANAAKTVIIKGDGSVRAVTNTGTAALFSVPAGVTLVLGNNLFLNGNGKSASAVSVAGGALVMNAGSRISAAKSYGIIIGNNGTFTMEGGEISGNTASGGGGVYVSGGTFTMEGGEISGNTASYGGGGVFVYNNGTFTMEGGEISGNTASSGGGGVFVSSNGTFTMEEGEISGNTASSSYGGGVYVSSNGTFTMEGGEISGNTASSYYGGGVFVSGGTFTMKEGEISGNTASYGGGVYVSSGTFTKQAAVGVEYGSNASDSLKNTATSGDLYGHAVYVASGGKIRNVTAGSGVAIDSEISGSAGGWEEHPISDIAYSSVSGGTWSLLADGRRQSPAIGDNGATKSRVSFTSDTANASITIQLDVSSESGYDFAFISGLDNANATFNSGYYPDSRISGADSVTVTIPVPTAGSHFIDIGYRKDSGLSSGSDCAWFKVIE
jgi:hypothetical protein